jgi:hypothetical protein
MLLQLGSGGLSGSLPWWQAPVSILIPQGVIANDGTEGVTVLR